MVRKSTVTSGNTDWSAAAGTTEDNSEWIVLDQNTWDYVGSHPHTDLEGSSTDTTIYTIQSGSFPDSTVVTVRGVVTAGSGETPDGSVAFYLQDGTGQYSGINVYISSTSGFSVSRGDSIEVNGETNEYYGKTQIINVSSITVLSTGSTLPDPEVLALNQSDWEPWEGVLVKIQNISVLNNDAGFGEWEVTDGLDTMLINNAGNYTYAPIIGDSFTSITGPLNYSYSNYKLIPRDDNDLVMMTTVTAPDLVINEFLANNETCCDDGNGVSEEIENEDFIEIHNFGTEDVDIGGLWTVSYTHLRAHET